MMSLKEMIAAKLATGEAGAYRVHHDVSVTGTKSIRIATRDAAKTIVLVGLNVYKTGAAKVGVFKGAYADVWTTAFSKSADVLLGPAATVAGSWQESVGGITGLHFVDKYAVSLWDSPVIIAPGSESLQLAVLHDVSGTVDVNVTMDLVMF